MIFCVSHADYDCYNPVYLAGPDVPDWVAYCNEFLDEAAKRAVVKEKEGNRGWVGYSTIMEALVDILCEQGYVRMRLNEYQLCGPNIIHEAKDQEGCEYRMSPDALKEVVLHNIDVDKRLGSELYAKNNYVPEWWTQYEQKGSSDCGGTSQPTTTGISNS